MNFENLIQNLRATHDTLFTSAAKAVNTAMTIRNWLYGYYIVEYERKGEDRAKYGVRLLKELSENINIKGISETNLKIFRQFYMIYPSIGQTLPDQLKDMGISRTIRAQMSDSNIYQSAYEQSPESTRSHFIQALPEQSRVNEEERIRQAVSDELKAIEIKAIQFAHPTKGSDRKPVLTLLDYYNHRISWS